MGIEELVGLTLTEITASETEICFKADNGQQFVMHHSQDCCESVEVDDICGDLDSLVGTPIVSAEEVSSEEPLADQTFTSESFTWTFYHIRTIKGTVTIRWYGTSTGYYSESVNFVEWGSSS